MKLRPSLTGAIAVLAMVGLAACSSSDPSTTTPAVNGGDPVAGGTAHIVQMSEPTSLDPTAMRNIASSHSVVGNALYGELVVDDDQGDLTYKLAESMTSDDDGTTWILKLRDGLEFSDGSPLTAKDVQENWERHLDAELASAYSETVQFIESYEPEGQTLSLTLTEPIANFPRAVLWSSLNWIAKPESLAAGRQTFDEEPIGAGPFAMTSWTRGGQMRLERNDLYFDSPRPYLDALVLSANPDEGQRFATVSTGAADALISSNPAQLARGEDQGLVATRSTLSGGIAMDFNARAAPFDDPRAREAVVRAVDVEAINQAAYEGKGEVPTTLFAESSPFYSDIPLTAFDKEGAQALFDELADEGMPVTFTITAYQTTESRRVSESVQAQLNTYDHVDVELEVLDFPAAAAKLSQRTFQMISSGLRLADPEPELYFRLHSTSGSNATGVSDPELDEALEVARRSSDMEVRKDAYKIVMERLDEVNPQLFYLRGGQSIASKEGLEGISLYGNVSPSVDGLWWNR
jgi:peptide/nickel transport system substrate-binding protein